VDAVYKCMHSNDASFTGSRNEKVSPPAVALLRVASKFSKVSRSEHILAHTASSIALLDIAGQKVYTVACGETARLPVVSNMRGVTLRAEYVNKRELGNIVLDEATYEVPAGSYNVLLGNKGLWCVLCFPALEPAPSCSQLVVHNPTQTGCHIAIDGCGVIATAFAATRWRTCARAH
jgi:hypothetical protein